MTRGDLTDLDAAATLATVERRTSARRAGDVKDMRLASRWCDLHSGDPQAEPGALPASRGGDRLLRLGGDGTPEVAELCIAELAIARGAGVIATENYVAAVLDLKYRMPLLWAAVLGLEVEGWVARKIAKDARKLSRERVDLVDRAVAAAALESPARQLAVAEAKIIEADPDAHRARLEEDARRTGVWLSKVRPGDAVDEVTGEPATRRITAKLPTGSAVRGDENVDDLAEAIYEHTPADDEGNRPNHAECRQAAFEMLLTDPHQAAAFLDELTAEPTEPAPVPKKRKRRPAEIVVHLTDRALCGHAGDQRSGVARVEGIGPMLLDQLSELLDDRDLQVLPVIDLNTITSVNGYEHPAAVKKRTLLRTLGDVFPHSTSRGVRRLDHDHATPWDADGPPGQTGDLNDAPLTRKHHRAKTHRRYAVHQLGLGAYRWVTPHGLARVVTPLGTRKVDLIRTDDSRVIGEIYPGPRVDYHPRR